MNDDWELAATLDASERGREILADGGKLAHRKADRGRRLARRR